MANTILEAVESVLSQNYDNFEVIVQDNDSNDGTAQKLNFISDPRIKYFKNPSNLGTPRNLQSGLKNCTGEILFLMAADDILMEGVLLETYQAFKSNPDVGAVTRPYYWFCEDKYNPIRATLRMDPLKNTTVKITDDFSKIRCVLDNEVLGQMSGLACRIDCIDINFPLDPWISHGYPFVSVLKKHSIVFLKDYSVAVRIGTQNLREKNHPLYRRSPIKRWVDLFENIFFEPELQNLKRKCIREMVARNYLGLIQIKNFGNFRALILEILYLVRYRWMNIFCFRFWFFSLGTILIPSFILLPLSDFFKEQVLSRTIRSQIDLKKPKINSN